MKQIRKDSELNLNNLKMKKIKRPTPETDAESFWPHYSKYKVCDVEFARKLERERDEAREKAERYRLEANSLMLQRDEARESLKHIGEYGTEEINAAVELRQKLASALVERDEAQKEFSSIHRWIERNHADGFIDSLTYLKNLERVMDCWYDRLDKIERERDEWKNKAYSHATDYTLMEAKCFRLEQELKEIHSNQSVIIKHYDKLKS